MPDITKKETGFSEAKAFKHVKALSQIPSPPFSSDQSPLIQGDKVTGTSGHFEKMLSSVAPDKHTCTSGNSKNWMVLSISGDKPTPRSYVPLEGFSALQGISGAQRFQIHKAYESFDHLSSIWSFDTYTECWSPMETKVES
ncbi:uncharacterized protein LOC114406519 isoform X3 [Glycine soja]|uniref:uncharacterized protein LOC114406519 isoform X3 n=1 Tax=Glycine soja TaxID=3848 RepID=UPI00103C3C57|nr:uncharacterized protein LOC114406519 isoform X3 [Glycine soja]